MGSWWREAQEKNLANEFAESAVRTPLVMTHVKGFPWDLVEFHGCLNRGVWI